MKTIAIKIKWEEYLRFKFEYIIRFKDHKI